MGRIFFFLIALLAIALTIVLFLPGLIPVAAYKDQIEAEASKALGREVTISDNLSFRIFPRTAFHVEDLQIANAEGFDDPYFIKVEEADIGVKLMPLLSDSVEIDRFVLTRPDIRLSRARNGAVNWNIGAATEPQSENTEAANNTPRELKLGDVRIVDGAAQFNDAAAGNTYTAEKMNLAVVLKSLAEPLEVRGDLVFQSEPSTVDLVLTSLSNILDKKPGNLKLNVQIGETSAGADLTVHTAEGLRYEGPITLNAPDLPAFAALVGTQLADAPGFDRLSLKGDVDGGSTALRLENATIGFDAIDAQGAMNLDWSGARPNASGVLSTDKLDLRPYMPPPAQSTEGFPAWSEAKMDFTSLRNIDAQFDISTNEILVNNLEMGESRIKLTVSNGRMTAEIPELSMYGGQGSGRVVVNARGATPSFAGNFDVSAVQAQPFTKDLMRHDNLLGLGSFKLNFEASGSSQAAIMRSIDGSGGFDLANGALKGVNIAAMVRAVGEFQSGFNPTALQRAVAEARGPSQQTDFSEFLSNFSIANGLVNTRSINMSGPYLTMTGRGSVNLAQQTIDIRLTPRGTTTLDGQGGRAVTVPVRIGGTFSQPTIGIDAEALARAGLQRGLTDLLDSGSGTDENGEEQEEDPAAALLRGILGGGGGGNPDPDGGPDQEASLEETLVNEGLNALFGNTTSAEQTEDKPDE